MRIDQYVATVEDPGIILGDLPVQAPWGLWLDHVCSLQTLRWCKLHIPNPYRYWIGMALLCIVATFGFACNMDYAYPTGPICVNNEISSAQSQEFSVPTTSGSQSSQTGG